MTKIEALQKQIKDLDRRIARLEQDKADDMRIWADYLRTLKPKTTSSKE